MSARVPAPDSRPFWPFETVDLGPDLERPLEDPDDPRSYPRIRATLFYRNRDLREIEERWGSLEGMETATREAPARTLPVLLWLGLRGVTANGGRFDEFDAVDDLPARYVWGEDAQVAANRALASAMGADPDDAERKIRAEYASALADDADEDTAEEGPEDPPVEAVADAS